MAFINNPLLSNAESLELEKVRRKIDIVTNDYLQDPNDPNFDVIRQKYFPGFKGQDTISATQINNVGCGIGYAVASVISYFVGNPIGAIDLDLTMTIQDIVGCGYGAIPLEKENNQYKNTYVPAYNYVTRNGEKYVYRFYVQQKDNIASELDYYMLKQWYGVGFIENTLYKFTSPDFNGQGVVVSLDTIEQTMGLLERVETGLDVPAIWVPSFRDNLEENRSLIDKIRNLIYSIDRNMVMYNQQFGMNMENFILFQNIQPNHLIAKSIKDGNKLNWGDVGRVHFAKEQNADIKFISNKNDLIDTAIAYEEKVYGKISGITSIPLDFLKGEASSGAIGQGSRSILHGAFIKQIKAYRELLEPIINSIYEAVAKTDKSIDVEWSRPDMFAKDENELINELSIAIKSGLISQRQAVMKYQDIHDEALDAELLLIKEDNLLVSNGNVNEKQGVQTVRSDTISTGEDEDDIT